MISIISRCFTLQFFNGDPSVKKCLNVNASSFWLCAFSCSCKTWSLTWRLHFRRKNNSEMRCFSPFARCGLLDFMWDARLLLLPSSFFLLLLPSSWPDLICQLLITGSSPDLICKLLIAVGLAGPHLPALDCCGPRRTSTARSRSEWASPDLNRRESELCGPRLAGPQPARFGSLYQNVRRYAR